ncbi:DUF222 domain-containing protein [Nakamurella flavida]|uniref:DUF222 domain-containing protein n=1 Tax=Nakamurella flavida TaxID=363630 RepID=A0A938YQS8_9ACTN|nr:DUF222 domain-containing protein [Nakamurella flavida]
MAGFVPEAAQSMAAGEVAAILRISPVTAGVRVRDAIRMCTDLPATLRSLSEGTIDRGKARVIADFTSPLPAHLTAGVEERVLPIARTESTAATRKAVGTAVIAVDPRGATERHEQARRERELVVLPGREGMSTVRAYLAADGAVGIFQLADLLATHTGGFSDDDRPIGARRADALADLADQILTHGQIDLADYLTSDEDAGVDVREKTVVESDVDDSRAASVSPPSIAVSTPAPTPAPAATPRGPAAVVSVCEPAPAAAVSEAATVSASASAPATADSDPAPSVSGPAPALAVSRAAARPTRRLSRQGRRPHLQVTLGLQTLAGLDDLPAHLAGHGAVTAGMARSIAASASTITALLAEPVTGAVISAGSHQYRPRQDLRDQVSALADSCRFPSCRQPVWRCDIDHRDRFDRRNPRSGGPTTTGNTDPLCRRHHLFKHHADWSLRRNPPTASDPAGLGVSWTSPTGHSYLDPPRQVAVPVGWASQHADACAGVSGPDGDSDSHRDSPDPADPADAADAADVADAADLELVERQEDRISRMLRKHLRSVPRRRVEVAGSDGHPGSGDHSPTRTPDDDPPPF